MLCCCKCWSHLYLFVIDVMNVCVVFVLLLFSKWHLSVFAWCVWFSYVYYYFYLVYCHFVYPAPCGPRHSGPKTDNIRHNLTKSSDIYRNQTKSDEHKSMFSFKLIVWSYLYVVFCHFVYPTPGPISDNTSSNWRKSDKIRQNPTESDKTRQNRTTSDNIWHNQTNSDEIRRNLPKLDDTLQQP